MKKRLGAWLVIICLIGSAFASAESTPETINPSFFCATKFYTAQDGIYCTAETHFAVENTGQAPIYVERVRVSLVDTSGNTIDTRESTTIIPNILRPGEVGYGVCSGTLLGFTEADVRSVHVTVISHTYEQAAPPMPTAISAEFESFTLPITPPHILGSIRFSLAPDVDLSQGLHMVLAAFDENGELLEVLPFRYSAAQLAKAIVDEEAKPAAAILDEESEHAFEPMDDSDGWTDWNWGDSEPPADVKELPAAPNPYEETENQAATEEADAIDWSGWTWYSTEEEKERVATEPIPTNLIVMSDGSSPSPAEETEASAAAETETETDVSAKWAAWEWDFPTKETESRAVEDAAGDPTDGGINWSNWKWTEEIEKRSAQKSALSRLVPGSDRPKTLTLSASVDLSSLEVLAAFTEDNAGSYQIAFAPPHGDRSAFPSQQPPERLAFEGLTISKSSLFITQNDTAAQVRLPFQLANESGETLYSSGCMLQIFAMDGSLLITQQAAVYPAVIGVGDIAYGQVDVYLPDLPQDMIGEVVLTPMAHRTNALPPLRLPFLPDAEGFGHMEDDCFGEIVSLFSCENPSAEALADGIAVAAYYDAQGKLHEIVRQPYAKSYQSPGPIVVPAKGSVELSLLMTHIDYSTFLDYLEIGMGEVDGFVYSLTDENLFSTEDE